MTLDDVESAVEEYLNQTSPGVTSFITLSKLRDIQVVMIGGIYESRNIYIKRWF